MPSWDLHNKWASMMGIPLDISKKVNEIIDNMSVHDLGEIKRISMRTPVHPGRGIYAKFPKITVPTDTILRRILENTYSDPVKLKYAFKATILHHWLDKIAKVITMFGTEVIRDSEYVINYAERLLTVYLDNDAYNEVRSFIKKNARNIIRDIADELTRKGVSDIGPEIFFNALDEFRRRNGWPGLVYIDKLMPIKATANKMYHELKAGRKVRFYFAYSGSTWGTRYRVSPIFEVRSIKEAMNLFKKSFK